MDALILPGTMCAFSWIASVIQEDISTSSIPMSVIKFSVKFARLVRGKGIKKESFVIFSGIFKGFQEFGQAPEW